MPNNVRIHTEVTGNAAKEIKSTSDAYRNFQKQGAEGLKVGASLAAGAVGFSLLDRAASTAIDTVVSSIHAASDLNETMSKSQVIFGKNADSVSKWAATMDDAAGTSQKAALDAAAGFAGLFKTVGLGIDQSTDYAKGLTQLGSDLASFFNTDVDEALQALKSGLNGEAEPLRRFNVFLSETAVSGKLAEMGVKKVGGQFTEAQKATARYALIMEQTKDAQGDFARTSDGMANSSRMLDAKLENLSARLGQVLLPAVEDGVSALLNLADAADKVSDSSAPVGDRLQGLTDIINTFNPAAWGMNYSLGEYKKQAEAAERAAAGLEKPFKGLTGNFGRNRKAAEDAAGAHSDYAIKSRIARTAAERLGTKVADLTGGFKDLKKFAQDAGDAIAEAAYGPEELTLAFDGAKYTLKENQAELDRVQGKLDDLASKGKKAPRALRKEFNDAELAVNQSKQEVIRLGTKLEATGGISMAALGQQFGRLGIKLDGLSGDAATLWWYLNHIANVDLGTAYDNQKHGKGGQASGGYIPAGDTRSVGEGGKREVVRTLPGGGAVVMPMEGGGAWGIRGGAPVSGGGSASGGGTGGGDTFIFQISAPVLTPGAAQAVADAIGPVLTKWQQDRQLLARR